MIGYMSIEGQADADFAAARRRSPLRRLGTRLGLGRGSDRLLCFEEACRSVGARGVVHLGTRVVRVAGVVGSVGRCSEFDRAFLPTRRGTGERWKHIDKAFRRAEVFPPVSLYEIGDAYFVLEGNHRVSVARFHGVEWIDAEVTRFDVSRSVDPARGEAAARGPVEASPGWDSVSNLHQKVEGKSAASAYK